MSILIYAVDITTAFGTLYIELDQPVSSSEEAERLALLKLKQEIVDNASSSHDYLTDLTD